MLLVVPCVLVGKTPLAFLLNPGLTPWPPIKQGLGCLGPAARLTAAAAAAAAPVALSAADDDAAVLAAAAAAGGDLEEDLHQLSACKVSMHKC